MTTAAAILLVLILAAQPEAAQPPAGTAPQPRPALPSLDELLGLTPVPGTRPDSDVPPILPPDPGEAALDRQLSSGQMAQALEEAADLMVQTADRIDPANDAQQLAARAATQHMTRSLASEPLPGATAGASPAEQLGHVRALYEEICRHYGLRVGLRHARKHLGWALDVAAQCGRVPAAKLRDWRQRILTSEEPASVHRALGEAFDDFAWSAAA